MKRNAAQGLFTGSPTLDLNKPSGHDNPRFLAVSILHRIAAGSFAEPLLDAVLNQNRLLGRQDRALLTNLVYGVLRHRGFLDWVIAVFYRGEAANLDMGLKNILRVALFQIFFTERIPDFAIVNEAVKITGQEYPRHRALVNAILRTCIRKRDNLPLPEEKDDPVRYFSIVHSHPPWLVEKLAAGMGLTEAGAFCRANNEIPPFTVRTNSLRATRDEVRASLETEGVRCLPAALSPQGLHLSNLPCPPRLLKSYREGLIQIQDEASQLISLLLSPKPGETVLDLCAGAGGKATHLAQMMRNEGAIIAVDLRRKKLADLDASANRLGVRIITTLRADAGKPLHLGPTRRFDRILLDAPCSGTGTLRRNPEIKWRLNQQKITKMTVLQSTLLKKAADYLKEGGVLVYATCSVLPEENERQIMDFLSGRKDFELCRPGASVSDDLIDVNGFFRSSPVRDNTDAFFGVVLRKR